MEKEKSNYIFIATKPGRRDISFSATVTAENPRDALRAVYKELIYYGRAQKAEESEFLKISNRAAARDVTRAFESETGLKIYYFAREGRVFVRTVSV